MNSQEYAGFFIARIVTPARVSKQPSKPVKYVGAVGKVKHRFASTDRATGCENDGLQMTERAASKINIQATGRASNSSTLGFSIV
jgi:hypothetical protein